MSNDDELREMTPSDGFGYNFGNSFQYNLDNDSLCYVYDFGNDSIDYVYCD